MFLSRCAMARFRNRFLQNTRSYRGDVFHNRSDARYVVRRISVEPPYTSHQSSASTTAMVPWAAAALILVGVLLWFAVPLAVPFAFRLWQNRHGQRGARGDDARSDGVAEQTDADASRELLPRIAAADAAAQAQIASERVRKGVLRRSRRVTFAPDLASDGENRERLPPSAEDTGAGIGATLCDAIRYNGVDVSAALSRDEDGDECFAVLRGDDIVLELKVRLLEFVRDDDAFIVWFTADRRQTSLAYPIWTLWPHDRRAFERLVAGLEEIPDCCCVSVDACSVKSASRCRRMAARANGCVY